MINGKERSRGIQRESSRNSSEAPRCMKFMVLDFYRAFPRRIDRDCVLC